MTPAATDQYLLQMPALSSKPAGHRCQSMGQADGRMDGRMDRRTPDTDPDLHTTQAASKMHITNTIEHSAVLSP